MPDANSVPSAPSKKAFVILAAIAILASAGGIFSFAQLKLQSGAWDQDRVALADQASALQEAVAELEATIGETAQAKSQLMELNAEVTREKNRLEDLARRVIGTQASLQRNIKARKAMEMETQEVRLQLDQAQSSLEPLRVEMTTRGQEIQDLEAVLREARKQLDQTIDHLEALRSKTSG